jgi:hypothetical protein
VGAEFRTWVKSEDIGDKGKEIFEKSSESGHLALPASWKVVL